MGQVMDAVKRAFKYALDGRTDLKELTPCEKCVIGVFVERYLRQNLGVRDGGRKADLRLPNGIFVDVKFSLHQQWMIPPNHIGRWLVLISSDGKRMSFGICKPRNCDLTIGCNRDRKRTFTKEGKRQIIWIAHDVKI